MELNIKIYIKNTIYITMSNLNDISIDKIETDVMSVLYANMDTIFTQYSLFSKLVQDKYDFNGNNSIHPNFKYKYLLVVRNLMSKYSDIKITRENMVYNIVCLTNTDVKLTELNKKSIYEQILTPNIKLDENDISGMYDYIYDNNLCEYINWSDPFDGNSVFHELVLSNNVKQIDRLVKENLFDYSILNSHNQTPVDLIKSVQVAQIIAMGVIKNYNLISKNVKQLKENVDMLFNYYNDKNYYESNEYKNKIINNTCLYDVIHIKTNKYHFPIKIYLLSFIVCYIAVKIFLIS
jgi:hypothetical protein